MQQTVNAPPRKRGGAGIWLFLIALLEIAAFAVLWYLLRAGSPCLPSSPAAMLDVLRGGAGTTGGRLPGAPAGGAAALPEPSSAGAGAGPMTAPLAGTADGSQTAAGAAGGGDARATGDLNEVPDPNCVGKAAAAMLSASPAPAAQPSCGALKAPDELKAAARQVQGLGADSHGSGSAQAAPSP
jgi:hypothetical protein